MRRSDLMKKFHLGQRIAWSLILCIFSDCRSLNFLLCYRVSFSGNCWTRHWFLNIAQCHCNVIALFCVGFFALFYRTVVFDYVLGSCNTYFLVWDHPSSVRYVLYHMEWTQSNIRYWLTTPTSFVPLLSSLSFRQDVIIDRWFCW